MKQPIALLAAFSFFLLGMISGRAQLIIDASFDSTITSDPNAALIESGINQAIGRIESYIADPITVSITFAGTNTGLGENSSYYATASYASYASALASVATSSYDTTALGSVPIQTNNPVNGDTGINLTLPLWRAFGVAINPPSGQPDSVISLNLSLMNLSRTGPQNPADYDLQAVVAHEMDEVLGVGGSASSLPTTTGPIGTADLFRYSAPGVRSYTTSSSAVSYFSIDGGVTDLVHFNQVGAGDYADWGNGNTFGFGIGNTPPQVQDAFGTPGADINLGANELIGLDVVGYTLTTAGSRLEAGLPAAPEPRVVYLLGLGLVALGIHYRRRTAA